MKILSLNQVKPLTFISLSTPFFSLLSLSLADSPLPACAAEHAPLPPARRAAARPCSLPGCRPAAASLRHHHPPSSAHAHGWSSLRLPAMARRHHRLCAPRRHYCSPPGHANTRPSPTVDPAQHSSARLPAVPRSSAGAPRRRHRDKRARTAPCLHPALLPCRASPSLIALPRSRSSIPAPLPSLS